MNDQHNPEQYEEMSAPYASREEANAALEAFADEVAQVRKHHRIGNVVFVASATATSSECDKDAEPSVLATYGYCGDSRVIVHLLCYALMCERDKVAKPLGRIDRALREVLGEVAPDVPSK